MLGWLHGFLHDVSRTGVGGRICQGQQNDDPKDPTKPLGDLYDSCVDNVADPSIFVVFTQEQAYPEYIIEY